jgi:hypothetical protein
MREEVRLGLEAGARTLSFGLIYMPGAFSQTEELVELAEEAAPFSVPLVPHVRNEADGVLEAVDEMVEVARRSGAPLHLSHLKVVGRADLVEPLLELLERARGHRHHFRPVPLWGRQHRAVCFAALLGTRRRSFRYPGTPGRPGSTRSYAARYRAGFARLGKRVQGLRSRRHSRRARGKPERRSHRQDARRDR